MTGYGIQDYRSAMKAVLALLLLVIPAQSPDIQSKIKTFRNAKRYTYEYDRFKNRTHVGCNGFALKVRNTGSGIGRVILRPDLYFDGTTPQGDARFYLTFEVYASDWYFLRNRTLIGIIDGKRINYGEGQHDGRVTGRYSNVHESLTFTLTPNEVEELTAGNIEMQIAGLELRLEDEHRESFRDLLSLTR